MLELRLFLTRTIFPGGAEIPAHFGPIPLAMLIGDFKALPHFLHLGFSSIVILQLRIQQYRCDAYTAVVLE